MQPSRPPCCGISTRPSRFASKLTAPLRPLSPLPAGLIWPAQSSLLTMCARTAAILPPPRYADCMLAQIFQSTACNAIHSIEQRTAKWIIAAMERTEGEDVVPLTHEQLATMLGVNRSYASRVIQTFKAEGVL